MSKHWLTEFWSFQSVKKVKPSIDLRHVPELFCETYSACIRILSVPKFVSVLSIWPACFSNTLSLCIFTWKVKGDYKNQIFFITQVNAALYKKHILHTFTSLLLSYKPLKGHILVFLKLLNLIYSICLSCHFLPPLTLLFLFAPSSVIFLCLSAKAVKSAEEGTKSDFSTVLFSQKNSRVLFSWHCFALRDFLKTFFTESKLCGSNIGHFLSLS